MAIEYYSVSHFLLLVVVFSSFLKDVFIYLLCIQCCACVHACTPEEGTRFHYRWLWATMWLLRIELRTSERVASALNL
jgi:heterodisulfide reductase subunit C